MKENSAGEDLVTLIRAMGQSEKRYFALHAQRSSAGGDKHALALYRHLQASGRWSEREIRSVFEGQPFLKQLNVTRTRLQQLILEALSLHDQGKSLPMDFARRFTEIDLLYRRKLLPACRRLLMNTWRRARALELPAYEYQALTMLLRLERQSTGPDLADRLAPLNLRQRAVATQLQVEAQLTELHDAMLALLPQNATVAEAHRAKAQALHAEIVAAVPEVDALHFDARILYHLTIGYHARITGHQAGQLEAMRYSVETWESLPDRIRQDEARYFLTLFSWTENAVTARRSDIVHHNIAKLKRFWMHSNTLSDVEEVKLLNLELRFWGESAEWQKALAMLPEVERVLRSYQATTSPLIRLSLLSNAVVTTFVCAAWLDMLHWAERLLTDPAQHASPTLDQLARTTRWVAWYELGEHAQLEKSLRPWIKTAKRQAPDALALAFFALLNCETEMQEKAAYEGILACIQAQQGDGRLPHHELLETWLHAKRSGVRIEEIAGRN